MIGLLVEAYVLQSNDAIVELKSIYFQRCGGLVVVLVAMTGQNATFQLQLDLCRVGIHASKAFACKAVRHLVDKRAGEIWSVNRNANLYNSKLGERLLLAIMLDQSILWSAYDCSQLSCALIMICSDKSRTMAT